MLQQNKFILKIWASITLLFIFFPINFTSAEIYGTCGCTSTNNLGGSPGSPHNCSECAAACHDDTVEIWNYDVGGARQHGTYPLSDISCTEDGSGSVQCQCGASIDRTSETDCTGALADIGVTCRWEGSFTDVGGSCTRDFGCRGTGCTAAGGCYCYNGEEDARAAGFSDLAAYWSDIGVSSASCYGKLGNGENCIRNEQCSYNFCGRPEGGDSFSSNICRTSPAPGEEETPPTEGEIFPTYNIKSPIGEVTGPQLIGRIIKTVLGIVGALALGMFVFGGFTWLTSGGSPDKIKKGKDILMWAVIGLIVIFTSYTLVDFILTAFGL